jgi:recombinational DNA repair protein RecR
MASTAKFNLEKTEFLPFGEKKFREKFIKERTIGTYKLEENLTIIKEGQAMRTLGAWVGNEITTRAQWDSIIIKQKEIIKKWSKMHLSYRGKELVLKALIQSRAMFLATVNGLPNDIETEMKKMYKDFVWDNKPRGIMKWESIIRPRKEGGLAIPDIKSRIEAIQIMWIKRWLAPPEKRPYWAYIMDAIIHKNIAKEPNVDDNAKVNWISQSWHESEAKETKISRGIKQLLKVARKYNIEINAPKYSLETKLKLPIWHNINCINNYQWNKKAAKEMRNDFEIMTIYDLIQANNNDILKTNAQKNITKTLINNLPRIINPEVETPKKVKEKNLDLTPNRIRANIENNDGVIFNPDVTAKDHPFNEVRIFSHKQGTKTRKYFKQPREPAYRPTPRNTDENEAEGQSNRIIWISTKIIKPGYENSEIKVGTYDSKEKKSTYYRKTYEEATKTNAILMTIKYKLSLIDQEDVEIITNNQTIINMLKTGYTKKENSNWSDYKDKKLWKETLQVLRNRSGKTEIRRPKTIEEENQSNELYEIIKNRRTTYNILPDHLDPKTNYEAEGARLQTMTQKLAYKLALDENSDTILNANTKARLVKVKNTVERETKLRPTTEMIWKTIMNIKPLRIADFIWKIAHGRIKCGKYFSKINGWEDKQYCKCNGDIESLEHIILTCKANSAPKIWEKIKDLWKQMTETEMKIPSIETLIGIGTYKIKIRGKEDKNKTNLFKLLMMVTSWSIETEEILQEIANNIRERILIDWDIAKAQEDKIKRKKRRDPLSPFINLWCLNEGMAKLTKGENEDKDKLFLSLTIEKNLNLQDEEEQIEKHIKHKEH